MQRGTTPKGRAMAGNGNRELAGKVALVTGAGRLRGIGRAAAMALARLGADVAVSGTGRDPATFPDDEKAVGWRDVDSVAEAIEAEGCRALALRFDVSSQEQTKAAVERIVRELGRIDILINNAAVARGDDRTPVPELDPDLFGRVVDVKVRGLHGSTPPAMGNCRYFLTRQRSGMLPRLKAPFYSTQAVIRHIYAQGEGGKIVNIASVAGKRGSPNTLAYNAANFAMIGMTQSMAREFGPHGVNVNCVCPGAVATSRMDDVSPDSRPQRTRPGDPVSRWGSDDEVGGFIAYLCIEAASWIHGQSIDQDGGAVMEH